MNKYKVCIPLDYIIGYLRYGHYELIFESEEELTEEEIKQYAVKNFKGADIVVDYRIEDIGEPDFEELSYKKISG
jgi:hypothetical protein